MSIIKKFLYFSFFIGLVSCGSKQEQTLDASMVDVPLEENAIKFLPPEIKADQNITVVQLERDAFIPINTVAKKIIKDGDISVKIKDIASSKKALDTTLKKFNAYYESEVLDNNEYETTYTLKIRVPSDKFESLLLAIEKGEGEVMSKNIQSTDVTEEYVDTEARLKNKKEYLKRYKDLLVKANTIKDILALEENIRVLQEEIESKEGRLKYLNDQVAYSTLNLTLTHTKEYVYKPSDKPDFIEQVKTSLSNGWESLVEFLLWLIKIWPWMILFSVLWFLAKTYWQRRKKKRSAAITE